MNLTHKSTRDHLAPVNTNLIKQAELPAADKQIPNNLCKNDTDPKIQCLQQIIQNLTFENQSMNAMIRTKNQQIINLKSQLKVQSGGNLDQRQVRQIYHLNSFRPLNGQVLTTNSTQLDKAVYQIRVITKQRDDLIKRCQILEQQYSKGNDNHLKGNNLNKEIISNSQHAKAIQQYQQHIAVMASKLSVVHQLEVQNSQLKQQKTLILNDFEGIKNELINRVGYCQHLQNQLRHLQAELNKRVPNIPNVDYQNVLNKCATLQLQVVKLNKALTEKQNKLSQIQVNKSGYIQVTKQAFQSMQNNINSLQQKIGLANQNHKKEAQKSANLQIQINRLNKEFSQKLRKAEKESDAIKKLEAQKSQLTSGFAKTKLQLKNIEKRLQDKQYEFDKIRNQNQKNKKIISSNNDLTAQIQKYKKKETQSGDKIKKLLQSIGQLESKYKAILKENSSALQFCQQSKKKWEHYDKVLKQNSENVMKINQKLSKRGDQLDNSMKTCLTLQAKLRQVCKKDEQDQIDKFIRQNGLNRNQMS